MAKTDQFSKEEAERRLVAALRGSRITGRKPYDQMKTGKSKAKRDKSPAGRLAKHAHRKVEDKS